MLTDKTTKSNNSSDNVNTAASTDSTVEVLYQRMGDRWFAFSIKDDEVFVGQISPEMIEALEQRRIRRENKTGNS